MRRSRSCRANASARSSIRASTRQRVHTELSTPEPFRGRRPIFVGDDVTDESVFAIMHELGGLAFSVGRRAQGVTGHFDEPRDVRAWLASLIDGEGGARR